jgi:hypothetical protein
MRTANKTSGEQLHLHSHVQSPLAGYTNELSSRLSQKNGGRACPQHTALAPPTTSHNHVSDLANFKRDVLVLITAIAFQNHTWFVSLLNLHFHLPHFFRQVEDYCTCVPMKSFVHATNPKQKYDIAKSEFLQ